MFKYCTPILRASALLWLVALLALPAQTTISGSISDGAGGPLTAGTAYLVTGSITVPTGQTLTIQPGAIVKFNAGTQLVVDGDLQANGTAGSPLWFLASNDDSVGGDTNGDGPSSGAPGHWRGIRFNATSSASSLAHATVRNTGWGSWDGAAIYGSDVTIDQCTFEDGSSDGITLNGVAASPLISNCHFANNAGRAVESALVASIPGFTDNTASGNGIDTIRISGGSVTQDLTIAASNCINGVLWCSTSMSVAAGSTLTLEAGVGLKWNAGVHLTIDGTLTVNGTGANPVNLTTFDDDSVGGDTNNDGPMTPTQTWRGVRFNGTSGASHLDHAIIGRSGWGGWAGAAIYGADVTIDDCIIRDCGADAVELNGILAHPSISGCLFQNNGGHAIDGATPESVPGISDNLASGNGTDSFRVTVSGITENLSISAANCLNGAIWFPAGLTLPMGLDLTIGAGVVCKFNAGTHLTVNGNLTVNGAELNPAYFTSIQDDSIAGDTANDGAPVGTPITWRGLRFNDSSDGSTLTRATIRYSGWGGWGGAALYTADITLDQCLIENCADEAIEMNSSLSYPTVTGCRFENNAGRAINNCRIDSLPGFIDNTATGNGLDLVYVSGTNVAQDITLDRRNGLGDVLYFASGMNLNSAFTLTLGPGLILKFPPGTSATNSSGSLDVLGDGRNPVVFTSYADDSYGGDTNNDGPPAGITSWRGVYFASGAAASTVQHALIRYSGWGGWTGFDCDSPLVSARSIRAEHATAGGINLQALAGDALNLVAFNCSSFGIRLENGTHGLVHATVTGCNPGITRSAASMGAVRNSISWGNTGSNFTGLAPANLMNCNGDAAAAGANGNIDADPLFVDASPTGGVLELQIGSPCVDAGDYTTALAVVRDHRERSRILDVMLTGSFLPDMGAYELPAYELDFTGEARLGTQITFTTSGPAGNSLYVFGLQDGEFLAAPWGFVTAGASADLLIFPLILPVGTPLNIVLPDAPALAGFSVGGQTLCVPPSGVATGNLTGVVRLTFFQ